MSTTTVYSQLEQSNVTFLLAWPSGRLPVWSGPCRPNLLDVPLLHETLVQLKSVIAQNTLGQAPQNMAV